jgi:hypothetical protein
MGVLGGHVELVLKDAGISLVVFGVGRRFIKWLDMRDLVPSGLGESILIPPSVVATTCQFPSPVAKLARA